MGYKHAISSNAWASQPTPGAVSTDMFARLVDCITARLFVTFITHLSTTLLPSSSHKHCFYVCCLQLYNTSFTNRDLCNKLSVLCLANPCKYPYKLFIVKTGFLFLSLSYGSSCG